MKKTLLCLCILSCFLFPSSLLYPQKQTAVSDSVSLSLEGLGKKEKLIKLSKLADVGDLASIERLEVEAKKQGSHLRLAHAYYLKQVYYQFVDAISDSLSTCYGEQALEEIKMARQEADKFDENELKSYQAIKKNITYGVVKAYLAENKYELALIYLNGMLEESKYEEHNTSEYDSYALLGMCYIHAKKPQQAFDSFKKAYEIYQEYAENKLPYDYCRFFEGMSYALQKLKDHKQMIVLNDSLEHMVVREYERIKSEAYPYHIAKFMARNYSAYALIKLGDLTLARERLDEARKIVLEDFTGTAFTCNYYEVEIQYYLAIKNYSKAKEYLNLYFECARGRNEFQGFLHHIEANLIKAEVLHKSGDSGDAYELISDLYQLNDSITAINYSNQLAELQVLYKVDKMQLESERDKLKLKQVRTLLIAAVIVLIFLFLIIYTIWKNGKALKEKNRQLYIKYSEIEKNNERIKELQSQKIASLEDQEELDASDSLVRKLEKYLLETQVYLNPELTREELALEMGTNRQYLIEAIKEKTGKTFNEYIYSFRLKYAYNQVVNDRAKSIADICYESGFASRGPFNRNFKEVYGMTPSELREILPK